MDEVTWTILALGLTGAGAAATWWGFTRRGAVAGLTALGWTLLVPAAWLTGVFTLLSRVGTAVARWVAQLAFDPLFYVGLTLAGVALALILVTSVLRARGIGSAGASRAPRADQAGGREDRAAPASTTQDLPRSRPSGGTAARDDEFDDIEALLRQRGIE